MLEPITLPRDIDSRKIPTPVHSMVHDLRCRIEAFQDRWDVPQIEQFVAADYELVYQTLEWIRQTQMMIGNRFLEWGCGFAAVTVLADYLGWDCVGVESESILLQHGRKTVSDWSRALQSPADNGAECSGRSAIPASELGSELRPNKEPRPNQEQGPELVLGNFLPAGAEELADDPTLPSLGHAGDNAYEVLGLELDDFSVVYSYPWPGEDEFHEAVFDRFAARGAILVQFCGPNDVRAWRAVSRS
ncbi:MAG: class I SAM-dependent methyltransferase [Rhodopirellula sp. JB053]